MARYLHPSALVAVHHLAAEAVRFRRPRRARRVRSYAPVLIPPIPRPRRPLDHHPRVAPSTMAVLGRVLEGLYRLEAF
ncbi:hypothetical protein GCM10007079_09700 [Nocardiopsis terrae]|uniref:Uncharacterized protein n=1 Tax=Nocardiopsis terrae TaxID=372655 RepID=A0ABR9HCQ3_9ACTN|nr:hypothetical protein [Nocardiopsis terrae]MBE1456815.1 hypothetical protein [Nocardiopsis terrae]GHC74978.1 hypothetical protein GCM10007079_09700 [Nocardiopsis terrae]